MKNKKYPAANLQFEATANAAEKKDSVMFKLAKLKIAGCYLAIDANSMQKDVVVTELDSVFNAGTSSFAVNYYGDENNVVFSSARDGNTLSDPKRQIAKYTSDIFTLSKPENLWTDLKKVEGPINTDQNEGAGFLTFDRERFFFTRSSTSNKNECDIYFSRFFNGEWLMSQKMTDKVNLEGYKSKDPCVLFDGSIIYFSSDRPGGYGKMDIWYEFIDQDGRTYGEPINMGPMFNTAEDEVSPYFHRATSTLYFSSDGHPGFGGLDVFKSSLNMNDSLWSVPKNLGQPINSSNDDTYFVLDGNQLHGFVTSDRKECKNCPGACNKIYSVTKQPNVYDVRGTVYNSENNQGIANATLTFKDIRSDWEPFVIHTDSVGNYFYLLKPGVELYMKAQKSGFLGDAGTVFTLGLTESKHFEKDFFLAPISSEGIVFPNVEFDNEMVVLNPSSEKILNDLADFLKLNNNLNVEIISHTDIDERGVDKNNIKLSEERSKSCADYLISKGIAATRLIKKGYGDTKLLIAKPKTADDHQKNRRTTFSIVK
jgi:outer membrane protein OmpA-like peptidoglycan-associated protein